MDLQVLANIGEFLGGLAILVSLVYLIVNVRQNTSQLRENQKALERTEQRSTYEQHDRYRVAMQNPETADLFIKGLAGEDLSPSESLRFTFLCTMITYSTQNNWDAGQRGVMAAEEWKRIQHLFVQTFVKTPGGERFWRDRAKTFLPGFVDEVDAIRGTLESD